MGVGATGESFKAMPPRDARPFTGIRLAHKLVVSAPLPMSDAGPDKERIPPCSIHLRPRTAIRDDS